MSVFRNIVVSALFAGMLAGVVSAGMHLFLTAPLILKAEVFESGPDQEETHQHSHQHTGDQQHEHSRPSDASSDVIGPGGDPYRNPLTVLAMVLANFGFALVIASAAEISGGIQTWRKGLLWGLAGYVVFSLAPGLGLPPELPSMPAADLGIRQLWWVSTAICAALAITIVARRRDAFGAVVGLAIFVVPFLLGAPEPLDHQSPIPASLYKEFVFTTSVIGLVTWLTLGGLLGWIQPKLSRAAISRNPLAA
jgi:cobalt transporter subunit CbtA